MATKEPGDRVTREIVRGLRISGVAQTSKSAVSQVPKPASASKSQPRLNHEPPADLEVCDTAGWETCATRVLAFFVPFVSFCLNPFCAIRNLAGPVFNYQISLCT